MSAAVDLTLPLAPAAWDSLGRLSLATATNAVPEGLKQRSPLPDAFSQGGERGG